MTSKKAKTLGGQQDEIMNSMTEKEIDTLVNLLRWLETRGTIIIVENDLKEIQKEIRYFDPKADVFSPYHSLNTQILVPKVEMGLDLDADAKDVNLDISEKSAAVAVQTRRPPKKQQVSTIGNPLTRKKKGRSKRLTRVTKSARKKVKEKEELDLQLALAEATRGTYIGKPPTPKPSSLLLLRRNYRPSVKCTITNVPSIPEPPPPPEKPPEVTLTPEGSAPAEKTAPAPKVPVPRPAKSYKCDQCSRILSTKASLKSHLITHSNLREIICEVCGKSFNHSRGLKRHLALHEGNRKYACNECPASFIFMQKLKQHMLTHTGEKRHFCSVCNRGFITSKHLKTHAVVHSEKRPFVCEFCPKAFRRLSHLSQHLRIHTGVKPFECVPCGKAFAQQTSLICHNRTYHKEIVEIEGVTTTATAADQDQEQQGQGQGQINQPQMVETLILVPAAPGDHQGGQGVQVQEVQMPVMIPWKRHLAQKSTIMSVISDAVPTATAEDQVQAFTWKPHLAKKSEVALAATDADPGQTTTAILVPVSEYNHVAGTWVPVTNPQVGEQTTTFYQFS